MAKVIANIRDEDKHNDDVEKLFFTNGHLYSGAYDGTVKMWTKDLKLVKTWQAHDYAIMGLTGDCVEGRHRLFTSSAEGEIKEWDPQTADFRQMTIMKAPTFDAPTCVKTMVNNNGLLYAGDMSGVLCRYKPNFVKDREKQTFQEVLGLEVSPDGKSVFTGRTSHIYVSDLVIDFQREEFQETLPVKHSYQGRYPIVATPVFVLTLEHTGMNIQLNGNDGSKYPHLASFKGHEMIINSAIISADDKRIVSTGWDGKVKVWDVAEEKEVGQVDLEGHYMNSIVWDEEDPGQVAFVAGKAGRIVKLQV